jgi:hypothetical protein
MIDNFISECNGLDTIALENRYSTPIDTNVLQDYDWSIRRDQHGKAIRFIYQSLTAQYEPRLTCSRRPDGFWYLRVEVSAPRFMYGSNVRALSDDLWLRFLGLIGYWVEEVSGKWFDATTATVVRVDFVDDIKVSPVEISPFFDRLRDTKHPRLMRSCFDDTSVRYQSRGKKKSKVIKTYSKLHERIAVGASEVDIKRATGQIRFEVTLHSGAVRRLQKTFGLPNRHARTILQNCIAQHVLQAEKEVLRFDDVLYGKLPTLIDLPECFIGIPLALTGFVILYRTFGSTLLKLPGMKMSRSKYYRYLSNARDLGLLP